MTIGARAKGVVAIGTFALAATICLAAVAEAAVYRNSTPAITLRLFVKPSQVNRVEVTRVPLECQDGTWRRAGAIMHGPIPIRKDGTFRQRRQSNPGGLGPAVTAIVGHRSGRIIRGRFMRRDPSDECWSGDSPEDAWVRFTIYRKP